MTTNKSRFHDLITFLMQLTPEQYAALNRMTGDPEDTVRLLADVSAFRRFFSEWNPAESLGASRSPTVPPLTSRYLRRMLFAVADPLEPAAKWIAQEARGYLAQDALTVAK